MKYLKLFENFDPVNILTASEEEVLSKQSFDYLCACLNFVARCCAGETKNLPNRRPIDELINAIVQYGNILNFSVNKNGNQAIYLDFQDAVENSYNYLTAIDKYTEFTGRKVYYTPSNFEKPTPELREEFINGFDLIKKIYHEFRLIFAGELGQMSGIGVIGQQRPNSIQPHRK